MMWKSTVSNYLVWYDIYVRRLVQGVWLKPRFKNDSNLAENQLGILNRNPIDSIGDGEAKSLAIQGYIQFPGLYLQDAVLELRTQVAAYFSENMRNDEHRGYAHIKDVGKRFPVVHNLLNERILSILSSYYSEGFRVIDYQIWRNYSWPNPNKDVNSNVWHFDQCRTDVLKIFIVLSHEREDGTNVNSGATILKDIHTSRLVVDAGFWSRWIISKRARRLLNDTQTDVVVDASVGSCYILNPQLCIHRAGNVPEGGFRDVLMIQVAGTKGF